MSEIVRVDVGFSSGKNIIVWGRKRGELGVLITQIQESYLYEDRVTTIRSEWREETEITDIFPKEIEFSVNERDIEGGQCGDPVGCAVAKALQRNYPEFVCSATPDYIRIRTTKVGDEGQKYQTNEITKNFVQDFDAGRKVFPFSARLKRRQP